ncbi:MAG: M20/M25/M40 family metallo-hydrolase [Syntrophobacterales bacterium]|jgi:Zn-dependent M28 family amino/carboxypeptidase|nr:M20/M25/M40 family metallo-hydrolase [Syntrophobacterales bacterium]
MDREHLRDGLEQHLRYLSVTLGDRSIFRPENLQAAEAYVSQQFAAMGYVPRRQSFKYQGQEVSNIIVGDENPGGYYILGAHYDTVEGTPGADDNASGVAVLLEVARQARKLKPPRPWAFIAFTCEEPPAFASAAMGSRVYAQRARRQQAHILGMLCLEMVGYYSKAPGSQSLPLSLKFMGYPTTGDFIGLVSDQRSRALLDRLEAAIKGGCQLPAVSLAVPFGGHLLPEVRLSDHANFWDTGYPAVMLTDTAFMRNPHYHGPGDTMDRLDLDGMTELTLGLLNFLQQEGR